MKELAYLLFIFFISTGTVKAQTWEELFRQKRTQRQYLQEQIAALGTYGSLLKEGYQIVNQGLQAVHRSADLEKGLHQTHFQGRLEVNPSLATAFVLRQAAQYAAAIKARFHGIPVGNLIPAQKTHLLEVEAQAFSACTQYLIELRNLATAGKLRMSDAERLTRLRQLLSLLRQQHEFAVRFQSEARLLTHRRGREIAELHTLKNLAKP